MTQTGEPLAQFLDHHTRLQSPKWPADAVASSVPERKMITGQSFACAMRVIAAELFNWQVISRSRYEELIGQISRRA
jgi:hypothetical protein